MNSRHTSRNHYRRLPENLKFPSILKCAHRYYDEHKDEPLLSIRIVKIFTGFFVPLAACWGGLLWLTLLFSPSTDGRDFRPKTIHLARSWALCIVFVVRTNWRCFGSIPGFILPSKSPRWTNEKASVETKGRAALEKVTKDLEALKRIYKITLNHRRECLALLEQKLVEDPSFSTTTEYASLLRDYEKQHQSINLIENALEAGNRDYQKVVNLTVSELNSRVNHHQSIAVWAQEAYDSYSHLINVISGVCLVGAGLTYTAIFSAVRGNVGLMCYSFSLFIVALCLIITVQFFLVWCSRLGTAPIWNPNGCEVMLVLFSSLACLAVTGAIVLLVVTVYLLSFNVVPGSEYQNGNAANWDAHLEFNVAPKQGAILGLSFLVATGASILILICLYIMAFGLRRFFWQRSEDAQVSVQLKLDDMV